MRSSARLGGTESKSEAGLEKSTVLDGWFGVPMVERIGLGNSNKSLIFCNTKMLIAVQALQDIIRISN